MFGSDGCRIDSTHSKIVENSSITLFYVTRVLKLFRFSNAVVDIAANIWKLTAMLVRLWRHLLASGDAGAPRAHDLARGEQASPQMLFWRFIITISLPNSNL